MSNSDILSDGTLGPDWRAVQPGTAVITSDGKRLGTVAEVRSDGFYVQGSDAQDVDYLVTPADIGSIDQSGVHLIVSEAQAMRAHWQGTNPGDASAPGGMAPGAMTREEPSS